MSLRLAWTTEQESAKGKQKVSKEAKRERKERRKEGLREAGRRERDKPRKEAFYILEFSDLLPFQ